LALELAFANRDLRALCLNHSIAKQKFGENVAEKLMRRLADMAAVSVVSELFQLPGNLCEMAEQPGNMMLELINGWYLIFKSGHVTRRIHPSGETDWGRVRRIKILGVEK